MPITKACTTTHGVLCNYHRGISLKVDLVKQFAVALVQSYPDEASYLAANPPAWNWDINIPLTSFTANLIDSLELALVNLATSPFNGGTRIADNADSLAAIQQRRWGLIKAERDRRRLGGILVAGKWFHSDSPSQIEQLGLILLGANIPAGLQWKTMDGTFILMTQTLAQAIFAGSAASMQALFKVAEDHRAAMLVSADPANYDFSTNWPNIYE